MKNFMMIMARKISTVLMSLLVVFQLAVSPVVLADSVTNYGDWDMIQETDEMDGTVTKFVVTKSENILSGWNNETGRISLIIPCEPRDDGGGPARRVSFDSDLRFEVTNTRRHGQDIRIKFDDGQTFEPTFGVSKKFRILGNDMVSMGKRELTINEMADTDISSANLVVIIDELKKAQKLKLEVELFNTEKKQIAKFSVAGLSEVFTHCDK